MNLKIKCVHSRSGLGEAGMVMLQLTKKLVCILEYSEDHARVACQTCPKTSF